MKEDTILVVDDNREVLTAVGALLEEQGYQVDYAFDGMEALEKIATVEPDLILMDIFMPGMGGLELADELKADSRRRQIPILAMSAIEEYETGELRRDLRADDFIRKPPAKRELLDKVERLLRRARPPVSEGAGAVPALPGPPPTTGKGSPQSERLCHLIAENSFDWQMLLDPGGRVLYCSPSSRRITGYAPAQFTADHELWNAIVHPLDRELWRDHRAAAGAGATVDEVQFRIVTQEGATRWIGHVCTPFRDEAGLLLGTLSSNRDITDRKALEARLLRSQRLETVGALTGGVAHDLNNVLTPILLGIEVLRDRLPDEAARRLFESMEISARRGADLVNQMMRLAKDGDGERAALQVGDLFSRIEKIVRETFPRDIRFSARMAGDLRGISANPVVLTQVLINLCLLARDAMPRGGSLEITAENADVPERPQAVPRGPQAGHRILLSVRHAGTSSPEQSPPRRAGVPGGTVTTGPAASSLAFETIRAVVQQHGGLLDVASEPGGGTTFRLSLPVNPTAPVEAAGKETPPADGNGELLLLVDDEGVIRESARAVLEGHGYRVICAGGGVEALAAYSSRWEETALVLIDMMMPIMDGRSTMEVLKRINPQVKVLAMSGLALVEGRSVASGGEFVGFLPKPFSVAKLLTTVHDVLHGRGERRQEAKPS